MSRLVSPGSPRRLTAPRILLIFLMLLVLCGAGGALWVQAQLGRSLPQLDGSREVAGLQADVVVERDGLGVPIVRGATRLDVSRALGFLHAQDRFFQMDLGRRQAAGELAALLGSAVVAADRANRAYRFRARARAALERARPVDRALIDAYTEGVNAGLAALGARPFEYLALRATPAPWRAEDSVLVVVSMFFTLQDRTGARESRRGVMFDLLPGELSEFLNPMGSEWDAPLFGPAFDTPAVPGPEVFDVRAGIAAEAAVRHAGRHAAGGASGGSEPPLGGSNSWAVAGSHSADGAALVANDMHLGIGVPNIWYRAVLVWTDPEGEARRAGGVTLPGTPAVVVGSNGHVAWGFTNSWADWTDLIVLETDPDRPDRYRAPDGYREIEHRTETIEVAGAAPETIRLEDTIWGPVIDRDHLDRPRVLRWVPLVDGGLGADFSFFDETHTIEQALSRAATIGIPAQNVVLADRSGRIAWTIAGRIPRRIGFDGRVPMSWADGTRGWAGWIDAPDYPHVIDPADGRIWTANARTVEGEWLRMLGDGGYDQGARARQIRDALFELGAATPRAMLAIQLDDRAIFHERWRDLLLERLTPAVVAGDPARGEFRRLVELGWSGQASVESVGYRLVRTFRTTLAGQVFGTITALCLDADPRFDVMLWRSYEGPLWRLVQEQPLHLLNPRHASWDDQIAAAVDATIASLTEEGGALAQRTWGERNTVSIRHPLSRALPILGRWLDMPREPLPGDFHMPRVQTPVEGASQRMVVSPGREEHGILHMPVGQSGHPRSPFYGNSHRSWVEGQPTPFLPGPVVHTLVLRPATR